MNYQTPLQDVKEIVKCLLWICLFVGLSFLSYNPKLLKFSQESQRMPNNIETPSVELSGEVSYAKN